MKSGRHFETCAQRAQFIFDFPEEQLRRGEPRLRGIRGKEEAGDDAFTGTSYRKTAFVQQFFQGEKKVNLFAPVETLLRTAFCRAPTR
jgi:hypothetical protein